LDEYLRVDFERNVGQNAGVFFGQFNNIDVSVHTFETANMTSE
jgi:hypothetical protein